MLTSLRKSVPPLLAATFCLSVLCFAEAQKVSSHRQAKKDSTQEARESYKPETLAPLPLEQVPTVPPQVSYRNGELTIVAHNSTLGDVLRAVRKQTGANFDVPPNATERVVTDLGPGPARDVLAALLNGSHFDYVILGSISDPTQIERLVLTPKTTAPETASVAPPPPPPQTLPNRFGQPVNLQQVRPAENDSAESDAADDSVDNSDDSSTDQPDDSANNSQDSGQAPTPKTPEQLLQELQRQQQLQQPGQPQIVYPNGLPSPNQPPGNQPEQ
jgi:hypothetical protein